jgi:hypothetical protein
MDATTCQKVIGDVVVSFIEALFNSIEQHGVYVPGARERHIAMWRDISTAPLPMSSDASDQDNARDDEERSGVSEDEDEEEEEVVSERNSEGDLVKLLEDAFDANIAMTR